MALLYQFCKFYLIKGKFTQSQVLSYYRLAPYHFSFGMDVLLVLKMSSPTEWYNSVIWSHVSKP